MIHGKYGASRPINTNKHQIFGVRVNQESLNLTNKPLKCGRRLAKCVASVTSWLKYRVCCRKRAFTSKGHIIFGFSRRLKEQKDCQTSLRHLKPEWLKFRGAFPHRPTRLSLFYISLHVFLRCDCKGFEDVNLIKTPPPPSKKRIDFSHLGIRSLKMILGVLSVGEF